MIDIMKLWVAEYSKSQDAMHVHQVEDAIDSNLGMILRSGDTNDYLMIGLALSHDGASAICNTLRKRLDEIQ